jgi:hypothetical protein
MSRRLPVGGEDGRLVQQHGGADVDPVRAEDARCRRDDDLPARQVHPKLSAFGGAGRLGREVVVGLLLITSTLPAHCGVVVSGPTHRFERPICSFERSSSAR